MSAYELGTGVGALLICAVGGLLLFKGFTLWNAPSASNRAFAGTSSTRTVLAASPSPAPQPPTWDDDFFGRSSTASGFGEPTPAVTNTRWHPDYSSPSGLAKDKSNGTTGPVLLVVGALVLAAGLFTSYRVFLAPSAGLEFPDELIGMERDDERTEVVERVQGDLDTASFLDDVELEGAVYTSGSQMLYIVGGEEGTTDPDELEQFGNGMQEGLGRLGSGLTMPEVDTGSFGGKMWCTKQPVEMASVCAWLDADTFGFMVLAAQGIDVQDRAIDIREAIQR